MEMPPNHSFRLSIVFLLFLALASVASLIGAEPSTAADAGTSAMDGATSFDQMMQVLTHRRCMNCHPAGDQPRQGEDSHLHRFHVQRGADGHGSAALACGTCHQAENNDFSGVPGAPHWHLAPRSMGWEGLNRYEIARAMLDPEKNGGRSPVEIERHLVTDPLVLWAFEPGVDHEGKPREKPPISREQFVAAVKAWFAAGAPIPEPSTPGSEAE